MSGLVASIGIKAILGNAVGGAWSGVKSAGKWIGGLDLVHLCLLAVSLFAAWQTVGRWAQHRHSVKVEAQLHAATEALSHAQANEATLKKAIADQNAAVAELGSKSAEQQNIAAKAEKLAAERAAEAEATANRLRQSPHSAPLKSAPPCSPSDALKDQWK